MSTQDTSLPPLPEARLEILEELAFASTNNPTQLEKYWYRKGVKTGYELGAAIAAQAPQPSPLIAVGEDGEGQENHCPECGAEPGQMCSDEEGTEHGRKVHAVRQAQQAQGVPTPSFNTSKAGRDQVARFFSEHLKRQDFTRYISDTLAADFACALAPVLYSVQVAAPQAEPQQKPCLVSGACKHGSWCTETYCQEHCQFVKAEPKAQAPAPEPSEDRRQLLHLIEDIVEEAEQDGATYYRIRDGKDILFSNMVGACARLLAQPEAPAAEAEPQPEREPTMLETLHAWATSGEPPCNSFDKGYEAAREFVAMQLAGIGTKGGE